MRKLWLMDVAVASCALLAGGCYTSARHVSAVRPDRVKVDARIDKTYHVTEVVLDDALSNRRADDAERLKTALLSSLQKNYPALFPASGGEVGLTIAVSCDYKYRNEPSDWSIFQWWLVPDFSTKETYWKLCVRPSQPYASTYGMFADLKRHGKKFPRPADITGAVRETVMWESFLLPTGWIPVPGEADWTSMAFFRFSPSTPMSRPVDVGNSEDAFRYIAFDPDCDGDVLAAAVVKCLNRQARQEADKKLIGGGK